MSEMTWEEWEQAYPAREVAAVPDHHVYNSKSYRDAERQRDYVEQTSDCAAHVVVHNGTYYVIWAD